jgi:hypothetical protein
MSTPACELDFDQTLTTLNPLVLDDTMVWSDWDLEGAGPITCFGKVEWVSADTAIVIVTGVKDPSACLTMLTWKNMPPDEKHRLVGKRIRYIW